MSLSVARVSTAAADPANDDARFDYVRLLIATGGYEEAGALLAEPLKHAWRSLKQELFDLIGPERNTQVQRAGVRGAPQDALGNGVTTLNPSLNHRHKPHLRHKAFQHRQST